MRAIIIVAFLYLAFLRRLLALHNHQVLLASQFNCWCKLKVILFLEITVKPVLEVTFEKEWPLKRGSINARTLELFIVQDYKILLNKVHSDMKMCNTRLYYIYKYKENMTNEHGIITGIIQKINNTI